VERASLFVCGALALGILAIYAPVRSFPFIAFDDPQYVIDNPAVESGLKWDGLVWAFTAPHAANWHPLTWLSHMLDVSLFGLDAGAHHVVNVAFHFVSSLLLFAVLRAATASVWRSAFVAMVFAFHPLRVESVAWISERKDVLSTCFWMATMAAYVGWVHRRGARWYALLLAAFAAGLLAKPMLVTLPAVLLLLDFWPLGRLSVRDSTRIRAVVLEKVPLLVLAALGAAATVYAQRSGGAVVALDQAPLTARLANAVVSYVRYVGAMLYPAGLAVFYPYRPWSWWVAGGAGIALVVVSALALMAARRHPYVLVGWLWYVVTMAPVIGLVQVGSQSMADRYTYVPQVGLALVAAWGAADVLAGWRHRTAALASASAAIAVACVALSARQVGYWRSTEALFEHALAVTRDNYLAHLSLGAALKDQGRLDEARWHYFEAVRLNPASAAAQVNVANVFAGEGKPAEAEAHYREALRLKPDLTEAHNGFGLFLARAGRVDEAIDHYRRALAAKPHSGEAHVNLGNALRTLGRYADAATEYREALGRHPDWADAHYGLAVSLGSLGDLAGAEREYREAIRFDPTLAEAQFGLGLVLQARGMISDAIAALRAAVRLEPDWAIAQEALAWALATSGDGTAEEAREALALAERARAGGDESPRLLDTLAAADAANGRFAEAASAARRAAELARAGGDAVFAADIAKRVELYAAGRRVQSSARVAPR
jgi:tetratricopeptide (TPR) repeat protein